MDIRSSLAAQAYAATRPATAPKPEASGGSASVFGQLAASFEDTLKQGETAAMASMTGDADPMRW